jgi:ElaB/YqjD/DUF883 family membrane-anchored ribosome-binding protein
MTELRVVSEPADVGEAREAIERSRERISETLGAIEDRLVETKETLRDRVDVLRPVKDQVRTRPWMSVALAAGVGAALGGVLGGSDDDGSPVRRGRDHDDDYGHRHNGMRASATREYRDLDAEEERRQRREYRARRRARLRAERFSEDTTTRESRLREAASQASRSHGSPRKRSSSGSSPMRGIRKELVRAITRAIKSNLADRVRGR